MYVYVNHGPFFSTGVIQRRNEPLGRECGWNAVSISQHAEIALSPMPRSDDASWPVCDMLQVTTKVFTNGRQYPINNITIFPP